MQTNIFIRPLAALWLTGLLLAGAGCNQEFLELKPLGQLTSANFFETEEHAIWATNAVYAHLRDWQVHVFSYIALTDIVSDDADKGSTPNDANFLNDIDNFTFDAGNVAPSGVWAGYYQGIYRANLAIQEIPSIEMDEALKARLVAECQFLRAYFYFNLVRWFGDLPLITQPLNPDEYQQSRVPAAQVYALIEADLKAAEAALPLKTAYPPADLGRATKGAAQGMLARMYLTLGNYPEAERYARQVIESGVYSLYPNYGKIFQREGEHSSESIFEVGAVALETGGGGSQYNEVQGVRGTPNLGWGFNRPSDDLVAAYEPGDPRREATILYPGEVLPDGSAIVEDNPNIVNERYNQKAWVPEHPGGNGNGPGNIRLMRYAEILLIAAEAANENAKPEDALGFLNAVRARARGTSLTILPDVTVTDRLPLRARIWQERRVELAMEQHRWFDLIRQGRAAVVMQSLGKAFVEGKHELFPIPQTEIDLSGGAMQQNPGYN
ncbi:MAG: RagB/SusD family nutrient uptake outer membrane protein [Bacteroidetes bacterium]|nr:MAG: RagB/SusD family nutrient uptake outer membrane protein [Bacteroidota bacterium]